MKHISIGIIAAFLIIGAGAFLLSGFGATNSNVATNTTTDQTAAVAASGTPATTGSTTPAATSYTLVQVATHNSSTSCWTAINVNIYDVTAWINQHPGGPQAIIALCGKDGSAAFNGKHGGQARPASELATFRIGALATN